jgi:hypothetical protein
VLFSGKHHKMFRVTYFAGGVRCREKRGLVGITKEKDTELGSPSFLLGTHLALLS